MKPTLHGMALASALLAGAGSIPSAAFSEDGASPPSGNATTLIRPEPPQIDPSEAEPEERPVSYTNEQAERGKKEYARECEECHGDDLRGGLNGGPPLRGLAFEENFADGLPASVLFGFMSSAMPPNAPGRLSPDTYIDLMAYILKQNGFQPGAALPSDPEALGYLIMEK